MNSEAENPKLELNARSPTSVADLVNYLVRAYVVDPNSKKYIAVRGRGAIVQFEESKLRKCPYHGPTAVCNREALSIYLKYAPYVKERLQKLGNMVDRNNFPPNTLGRLVVVSFASIAGIMYQCHSNREEHSIAYPHMSIEDASAFNFSLGISYAGLVLIECGVDPLQPITSDDVVQFIVRSGLLKSARPPLTEYNEYDEFCPIRPGTLEAIISWHLKALPEPPTVCPYEEDEEELYSLSVEFGMLLFEWQRVSFQSNMTIEQKLERLRVLQQKIVGLFGDQFSPSPDDELVETLFVPRQIENLELAVEEFKQACRGRATST